VHHLERWADGGRTDLDGLGLLCWYHHHLTHRHEVTHELIEDQAGRLQLQPRSERQRTQHSDAA